MSEAATTFAEGHQDLMTPPTFATVEDERLHRKQRLAGAPRLSAASGFPREWPGTSRLVTQN